jgi:hypothetical protein
MLPLLSLLENSKSIIACNVNDAEHKVEILGRRSTLQKIQTSPIGRQHIQEATSCRRNYGSLLRGSNEDCESYVS